MTLLIRDALVYDGSGAPGMRADVAVEGDGIVAVGPDLDLPGAEIRDARGLALAPGFIDVHTHDDAVALEADGLHPKLSQGVTTVVTGNCGISLAPSPMAGREAPPPPLDLIGEAAAYRFPAFADFLDALRAFTPGCNVVPLVGHHVLRARAMADLARGSRGPPTPGGAPAPGPPSPPPRPRRRSPRSSPISPRRWRRGPRASPPASPIRRRSMRPPTRWRRSPPTSPPPAGSGPRICATSGWASSPRSPRRWTWRGAPACAP